MSSHEPRSPGFKPLRSDAVFRSGTRESTTSWHGLKTRAAAMLVVACLSLSVSAIRAAESPKITLKTDVEEGKKMLVATVTVADKPVEDATVNFFARRTFGSLSIGSEKTLDDGTAAVPFPADLPGGASGDLQVIADVVASEKVSAAHFEQTIHGATVVPLSKTELPRALWAPNAPMPLIGVILGLMLGVWATYLYVVFQIFKVKQGAKA